MGRKLASGGFGTVYRADLVDPELPEGRREVIVKKATEFGEAEVGKQGRFGAGMCWMLPQCLQVGLRRFWRCIVACCRRPQLPANPARLAAPHLYIFQAWMNERMMRCAPKSAAEFITAFSDGKGQMGDSTWLVWAYEGDDTLADLMTVRWLELQPGGAGWGGDGRGAAGCIMRKLQGARSRCPQQHTGASRAAARPISLLSYSQRFVFLPQAEEGVPLQPGAEPVWAGAEHPQGGVGEARSLEPASVVSSSRGWRLARRSAHGVWARLTHWLAAFPRAACVQGPERKAAILRVALQQLLECLQECHAVGE